MEDQVKNLNILVASMAVIFAGFFGYITYQNSTNVDNDKTTINALSSFTVKNNPNAENDYERLVAYTPKTDKGDDFKAEKVNQKLNEIRTFGKK